MTLINMRRTLAIALVLILFGGMVVSAQDAEEELTGPFGISVPFFVGFGGGLNFGIYTFNTGDAALDEALSLLSGFASVQAGGFVVGGYKFSKSLSAGAEIGFLSSLLAAEDSTATSFYLRGVGRAKLGPLFAQPHLGGYFLMPDIIAFIAEAGTGADPTSAVSGVYLDVGAKVGLLLGPVQIHAEVAYMIGQLSHARLGLGAAIVF